MSASLVGAYRFSSSSCFALSQNTRERSKIWDVWDLFTLISASMPCKYGEIVSQAYRMVATEHVCSIGMIATRCNCLRVCLRT